MSRWPMLRPARKRVLSVLILTAVLSVPASSALSDRISTLSLSNGLTVVYEKNDSSPLTAFTLLIKGGLKAEPKGLNGVSYLMTRLMVEIPSSSSAQRLMELPATVTMTARGDFSLISVIALSERFEETLKVVAEPIQKPLFSSVRLDYLRDFLLNRQKGQADDNLALGHAATAQALFGPYGYGSSHYGTESSVKAIKTKNLDEFYKASVRPANVVLAVVSDLDVEKLVSLLERSFRDFPAGPALAAAAFVPSPGGDTKLFIDKDIRQTLVSLGFALPALSPRTYVLASLCETLLGKGPGSRLWPLRQKQALAYNVGAVGTLMIDAGMLQAYLETSEAQKDRAAESLKSVIKDVWENGVTGSELEDIKAAAKANFLRANEMKEARAESLAFFQATGLPLDYFSKFELNVDKVTLNEINEFIRAYLNPELAVLVVVGPKDLEAPWPHE